MRLIFLGAPGAGKGTQATRLAQQLGFPHISTGDMLRETVKEDNPLAREIKDYLDSGQLVPDDKMNEAVRARLAKPDTAEGFILDGYPRTRAQAHALGENLTQRELVLDAVVYFNLPQEAAVERLSGRRTCKNCGANFHVKFKPPGTEGVCDQCGGELYQREDDNPEVIKKRFREYQEKTSDLVGFYRDKSLLREIDATPGPKEIYARVLEALGLGN
jgi:adenylate kinase